MNLLQVKEELKLLEDDFINKTNDLYLQINRLIETKTEKNKKDVDLKIKTMNEKIDKEFLKYSNQKHILTKKIKKLEKPLFKKQFQKVNFNKRAQKDILKHTFDKTPEQTRQILKQEWASKKSICPNPKIILKFEHFDAYNSMWEYKKETLYKYPKDFFPITNHDILQQNSFIFYQDIEGLTQNVAWIKKQEDYIKDLPSKSIELLIDYSSDQTLFIGLKNFWKQRQLASIIENSPPLESDLIVNRGISKDYFPKKNKMFLNKRFVSTTYALHPAFRFMGNLECCVLQILLPKGTRCIFMPIISVYPEESEILLPINTTFKILNKDITSINDTWKLNQSPESYPFQKKIIKVKIPGRFKSFMYKYFGLSL